MLFEAEQSPRRGRTAILIDAEEQQVYYDRRLSSEMEHRNIKLQASQGS